MINETYYRRVDDEGNTHTGVVSQEDGFSDLVYYFVSMHDEPHAIGDRTWTASLSDGHDFLVTSGMTRVTVEVSDGTRTGHGQHVVEAVQELFAGTDATGGDVARVTNELFNVDQVSDYTIAFRNA